MDPWLRCRVHKETQYQVRGKGGEALVGGPRAERMALIEDGVARAEVVGEMVLIMASLAEIGEEGRGYPMDPVEDAREEEGDGDDEPYVSISKILQVYTQLQ